MDRLSGDAPASLDANRGTLITAQARAREPASGCPLFTDPYVQALLDGLGNGVLDGVLSPGLSARLTTSTKWFDEFFVAAGAAGITQVVILAAGLETRPWRLPWLADTVIFEIDRPNVLAYKAETIRAAGAETPVKYVPVPVAADFDWSASLRAAGFDHDEPTAWSAEGVLPSLPDEGREALFDQITLYSARGSRIAMDVCGAAVDDVVCTLCCRGWGISSFSADRLMRRYHRSSPPDNDELSPSGGFVEGRLG